MKPHILTLTGPSLAGKSTLERMLKDRGFAPIISTTTRAPRNGEIHGHSYYFIGRGAFEGLIRAGKFVENVDFGGNLYGVTIEEIERVAAEGKPIVMVVEPVGHAQIRDFARRRGWHLTSVFVSNPLELIFTRFLERYVDQLNDSNIDHPTSAAAKRLVTMVEVERKWLQTMHDYDVALSNFDETNAERIAHNLTLMVRLKMGDTHGPTVGEFFDIPSDILAEAHGA